MIHLILCGLHYLIAMLFGLAALLITIPAHLIYAAYRWKNRDLNAPKATSPWTGRRVYHDIAFSSFFVLSLIAFWTSYLVHHEFTVSGGSTDLGAAIGMGVIGLFGVPLVVALVLGPGLSLFLWRNYLLLILSILTIVVFVIIGNLGIERWPMILLPFAVILMAATLVWCVRLRRTWKQATPTKQ